MTPVIVLPGLTGVSDIGWPSLATYAALESAANPAPVALIAFWLTSRNRCGWVPTFFTVIDTRQNSPCGFSLRYLLSTLALPHSTFCTTNSKLPSRIGVPSVPSGTAGSLLSSGRSRGDGGATRSARSTTPLPARYKPVPAAPQHRTSRPATARPIHNATRLFFAAAGGGRYPGMAYPGGGG